MTLQLLLSIQIYIKGMEVLARTQTGPEREAADRRIADLKRRRDMHWARSQTLYAGTVPIRRAEPVGERTASGNSGAPTVARRATRIRVVPVRRMAPVRQQPVQGNFFQRLFR